MAEIKRLIECRLIVIAIVDLASDALSEVVPYVPEPISVASIVATEIRSNLESVDYIDSAIVVSL